MMARIICKLLAVAACTAGVHPGAALAVDNNRHVSIAGSDANVCTLAAPCRSLQRGINKTPAGGELHILESGDYGSNATIVKSMTISGNGNTVILASPVTINDADAVVALRGLTLNGRGTIDFGIRIDAASAVHIERCLIHGFDSFGVRATAPGVGLFVLDSVSRDNGVGLLISAGTSRLTVDNSRFENNFSSGIQVLSGNAAIHRSTLSGNGADGILAQGGTFVTVSVSVMSTMVAQNGASGVLASVGGVVSVDSSVVRGNGGSGLRVAAGGLVRISNSTFTGNTTGISNGETLQTRQNNTVAGNTTNLSGAALSPIGGI
jgi:hypothetical protein